MSLYEYKQKRNSAMTHNKRNSVRPNASKIWHDVGHKTGHDGLDLAHANWTPLI